jgi:hypothetical protein
VEYVVILEAVKEIKFLYYLLQDIGIEVDLPIVVKTDNIGALFMSQNASTSVRFLIPVIILSVKMSNMES